MVALQEPMGPNGGPSSPLEPDPEDAEVLDAYSRAVSSVAERL